MHSGLDSSRFDSRFNAGKGRSEDIPGASRAEATSCEFARVTFLELSRIHARQRRIPNRTIVPRCLGQVTRGDQLPRADARRQQRARTVSYLLRRTECEHEWTTRETAGPQYDPAVDQEVRLPALRKRKRPDVRRRRTLESVKSMTGKPEN
jgi:hypothetical protein